MLNNPSVDWGLPLHSYLKSLVNKGEIDSQLSSILWAISIGSIDVAEQIAHKPFSKNLNTHNDQTQTVNVSGDDVLPIDMLANEIFTSILSDLEGVGAILSEEIDFSVFNPGDNNHYYVAFDPIDGSKVLDLATPVGSIFGIYRSKSPILSTSKTPQLPQGRDLVASIYVLYSMHTYFVFSIGNNRGIKVFANDVQDSILHPEHNPALGDNSYKLIHPNWRVKEYGDIISVNESNQHVWTDSSTQDFCQFFRSHPDRRYTSRFTGSLVADFHRNVIRGGVFAYPAIKSHPQGWLRLLYEAAPLAFMLESAGGLATTGDTDILDVPISDVHQRVPLCLGSPYEVEVYKKLFGEKL